MNQKHDELKVTLKESIEVLTARQTELDKKVSALQEKMIRMMAIFSVIAAAASFVAPYLVKALMTGAPS